MMKKTIGSLALMLLFALWLLPLFWLVITSLKAEQDVMTDHLSLFSVAPSFVNYVKAFGGTEIRKWFMNSVIVASCTTFFTLFLDSTMAYALSRIKFRGRNALLLFILAGMMVPFEVIIIQLYLEFNALGILNSLAAVILPRLALPIGVFILTQFFKGIPEALEEAAYMDGASRFLIFRAIILPLGKSALFVVAILSFVNAWNDFLWPLVSISDSAKYTITVGIANFQGTHGTEYALIMAGAVIASIPLVAMYLVFKQNIVKGIAMTGIKG
ncbi:MAG TPA: carbohydrate ABC transporter permease [Rectinemataceae bacterium]|nr:carbohydrate ABC transporter permease [Rectinemataceae bacterium]